MTTLDVLALIGVAIFMGLIWGLAIWFVIVSHGAIREERLRQEQYERQKRKTQRVSEKALRCVLHRATTSG